MQTSVKPAQKIVDKLGDIWQIPVRQTHNEALIDLVHEAAYARAEVKCDVKPVNPMFDFCMFDTMQLRKFDFIDEARFDNCFPNSITPCVFRFKAGMQYFDQECMIVNGVAKLNPPVNFLCLPYGTVVFFVPRMHGSVRFVCGLVNQTDRPALQALVPVINGETAVTDLLHLNNYQEVWSPVRFHTLTEPLKQSELCVTSLQQQEAKNQQQQEQDQQAANTNIAGLAGNAVVNELQAEQEQEQQQPISDSASKAAQMQMLPAQQVADKLGDIWQLPVHFSRLVATREAQTKGYGRQEFTFTISPHERLIDFNKPPFCGSEGFDFIDEVRLHHSKHCGPCYFRLEGNETFAIERYNFVDGVAKINPPLNVHQLAGIDTYIVGGLEELCLMTFVCGYLNDADRNFLKSLVPSPVSDLSISSYLATWSPVRFRTSAASVMTEDSLEAVEPVEPASQPLQDFDTSKLFDLPFKPCVLGVIGSRRCGKTVLMQDLVKKAAGTCAKVVVFSNKSTDKLSWPPSTVFVEGFNEHVVCSLVAEQKATLETQPFAPRVVVVFDEVSHESKNSKCFTELISNCRHFNTAVMMSFQCGSDLPAWLRSSTDFTFYFPQNHASRKHIHDHYFSQVQTLVHFDNMCKQLKTNEALVSDYDYLPNHQPVTKYRAEYSPSRTPEVELELGLLETRDQTTKGVPTIEKQQPTNDTNVESATSETQPTTLLATVQALQENANCARLLAEKRAELMKLLSQYAHFELMLHATTHQSLSEQLCAQHQLAETAKAEAKAAKNKLADVISVLQALVPAPP